MSVPLLQPQHSPSPSTPVCIRFLFLTFRFSFRLYIQLDLESIGSSLGLKWDLIRADSGESLRFIWLGGGWGPPRIILSTPVHFRLWIWDLRLGPDLGLGIGLVLDIFLWVKDSKRPKKVWYIIAYSLPYCRARRGRWLPLKLSSKDKKLWLAFPFPPTPDILVFQAYLSLVQAMEWTDYLVLYEDNEGLVRVFEQSHNKRILTIY